MRAIKVYCPPGVEPPLYAFIDALDGKLKAKLLWQIFRLRNLSACELKEPHFKHFSLERYSQMYELREKGKVLIRIVFTVQNEDVILLTSFIKRQPRDTMKALDQSLYMLSDIQQHPDRTSTSIFKGRPRREKADLPHFGRNCCCRNYHYETEDSTHMKKIISTCIALMVSAACSISAFAMEVPTNTTIQDLNGVRQYIKIYTVAPDTDPQSLIDDVFEYDGYTYTYSSMTKEERSYSEKEHHTETVTADTEKSDLSVVLKALSPSIEYDDGEFRGTLYLDHSTISTVASGYTTKSYTVSTTKEIGNLDTNDMAYVPDTTTKNGVTVQLQSVDWQVQGTSLVDDILVPAQYKAVATYAGRASYRAATGYVTTAKYIGDIVAEGIESVTYTVIYTGTPSSILQRVAAKSAEDFPVILISLVVIVLAITAAVLIWRCHKRRQEDTVYHEDFSEEEDEHEE